MKYKILRVDKINSNNVYIPKSEVLSFLNNVYDGNEISCEIEPPNKFTINIEKVSHKIIGFEMDGDYLVADIEVLDTPYGLVLTDMLMANPRLHFAAHYTAIIYPRPEFNSYYAKNIHQIKCFVSETLAFE